MAQFKVKHGELPEEQDLWEMRLVHFLDSNIKEIRIFSRHENKQDNMRHRLQVSKAKLHIGDVRNKIII